MDTKKLAIAGGAVVVAGIAIFALTGNDAPAPTPAPPAEQNQQAPAPAPAPEPAGALHSFTQTQLTDGLTTFYVVENPGGGPTLSFAADSGIELITLIDGDYEFAFRNMSGTPELEAWEDWRLPAAVRAADLAPRLTVEQLSGLMLFSGHTNAHDLMTPTHEDWIRDNNMRLILNAGDSYVEPNVQWNNQMQAFAESVRSATEPLIPVNIASDPRSTAGAAIYDADGEISGWPGNLGLAATFNERYMLNFATMASAEYRALGIVTALSPQVDLATDPRWVRNEGTLGEDLAWAQRLAAVYVDGFQNSYGQNVWGSESVATMIKHFGGDGPNEGGRGGHLYAGAFEVFPGGGQYDHMNVFAYAMHSAGVMTGYPIALDRDGNPLWSTETRDREGNIIHVAEGLSTGFNVDVMNFLRQNLGFEGAIVTDWAVTNHPGMLNTGWGTHGPEFVAEWAIIPSAAYLTPEILEEQRLGIAQRIFVQLVNGNDKFGGLNQMQPVIGGDWTQNRTEAQGGPVTAYNIDGAFQMWQRAYELGNLPIDARTRWEESAVRILTQFFFEPGLYENPFLDLENSLRVVGAPEKQAAGFEAQLASVVMLSNDGAVAPSTVADWANMTVYIPASKDLGWGSVFGGGFTVTYGPTMDLEIAAHFFGTVLTDEIISDGEGNVEFVPPTAEELAGVDLIIVGMDTPNNGTQFSSTGFQNGEWQPFSLQWGPYVADGPYVRRTSISGMLQADGTRTNRSYFGNAARISNPDHLVTFERAAAIGQGLDVPVITLLRGLASSTFIPTEIYSDASAILLGFGISDQALLEVGLGLREPSGRLPITMPADMNAVERQLEDIANTDPFIDSNGNAWGFGFGLNFSGVIN